MATARPADDAQERARGRRRVLGIFGGNRTLAAQHLGITRQTLTKRLGAGDERE